MARTGNVSEFQAMMDTERAVGDLGERLADRAEGAVGVMGSKSTLKAIESHETDEDGSGQRGRARGVGASTVVIEVGPDGIIEAVRPAGMTPDRGDGVGETHSTIGDEARALGDALEAAPYPVPEADRFRGTRGYVPADDLALIAEEVVAEYGEQIGHCAAYTIVWLWKGKANRRGWTKPAKDLLGHFAGDVDFIIWLGADVLREEQFTHGQVRKQVVHELMHIQIDGKVNGEHDFEGFTAELELFGPWTAELARARRAMEAASGFGPLFDRAYPDAETPDDGLDAV